MKATMRKQTMRLARAALLAGWPVLLIGGCDGILDVENPGSVTDDDLDNPALLETFASVPAVAGAEYHSHWVMHTGLIGNDFIEPSTRNDAVWTDEGEFHLQPNGVLEGLYDDFSQATWVIRDARQRITELVENPDTHPAIAEAYFWDGIIQVSRADMFEELVYDRGEPYGYMEGYAEALDLLQEAIDVSSAGADTDENMIAGAYGTMARIERSLYFETGDPAHLDDAAALAQQALDTDPNFRVDAEYNSPGRSNTMYNQIGPSSSSAYGVGPIFAEDWTDPVTGEEDPRVAPHITEKLADLQRGPSYKQTKYDVDTDVPVARWQEAVLIIAEHLLETGEPGLAVDEINRVRNAAGITDDFSSSDEEEIRGQLFYERQSEFFLEGRNWQDHRYYDVFPVRWNETARNLGLDRRVPMSRREQEGL